MEQAVIERLRTVIDPETPVDVMRMRLIEALRVEEGRARVSCRYRPSSTLCPLAVLLALAIREAVAGVPGVKEQAIEVVGYVGADDLNELLEESA